MFKSAVGYMWKPVEVVQGRVQQCECSRAVAVLVSIFICNALSLPSIHRVPESARIVELVSSFHSLRISCGCIIKQYNISYLETTKELDPVMAIV